MAWPADNLQDEIDTAGAAHINNIVKSVKKWEGNVDANTQSLSNLGTLRIGTFAQAGNFSVDAPDMGLVFRRTNGPTDEKLWDVSTGGGGLALRAVNDAYTAADVAFWIHRTGVNVTRFEVHTALRMTPENAAGGEGGHLELMDPTGTNMFMIDNYLGALRIFKSGGGVMLEISAAGQVMVTGPFRRTATPVYASNAAAVAAGLAAGTEYRTATGEKREVY